MGRGFYPFLIGVLMNWYVIDKDYITYLLQFDSRVGYVEYGDRLKLHVGVVLAVGEFLYYVPVSSPKEKHRIMSNSLDFYKLQDPVTGYLYAVLNLNNMIPVPNHCLTQIKYDKLGDFRYFKDENHWRFSLHAPFRSAMPFWRE